MQETEETWVQSLGQEDPLEEGMATHSSILAWRIPWTEQPDGTIVRRVCAGTHTHTHSAHRPHTYFPQFLSVYISMTVLL